MASLVQEPSSISQNLNTEPRPLRIVLDIGSTTGKAVVLDDSDSLDAPLFADYRRHHANVRATMAGLLRDIRA
ncbi:hypothetical protein, partial [Bifidobacterium animalis]|uniref:hypothetical protein n=1 Tax=Bifidobacterium animalis TaxID=28025 RepID=UPI001D0045AD